jgi:hypothetical protein
MRFNEQRLLLIGTAGGIAILNLDAPGSTFQLITTDSGHLPNNTVYRIFLDAKNRIYASRSP